METISLSAQDLPALPQIALQDAQPQVRPGHVWSVVGCYDPVVIAGDSGEGWYRAYPLVEDVVYLSDRDLYLASSESPLGGPAMVAAWLVLHVERTEVLSHLGEIPAELVALADRVGRGQVSEHERIGTPLTGPEDPRYRYQARQLDVWQPVLRKAYTRRVTMG